jgi:hypothetical protein
MLFSLCHKGSSCQAPSSPVPRGSFRDSAHTVVGIRSPPGALAYLRTSQDGSYGLPRRFAPRNDPAGDVPFVRRLSSPVPRGSFRTSPQTGVGIRSPPGALAYLRTCIRTRETDCHVASLLAMTLRGTFPSSVVFRPPSPVGHSEPVRRLVWESVPPVLFPSPAPRVNQMSTKNRPQTLGAQGIQK